jgi:hypothetical protein
VTSYEKLSAPPTNPYFGITTAIFIIIQVTIFAFLELEQN